LFEIKALLFELVDGFLLGLHLLVLELNLGGLVLEVCLHALLLLPFGVLLGNVESLQFFVLPRLSFCRPLQTRYLDLHLVVLTGLPCDLVVASLNFVVSPFVLGAQFQIAFLQSLQEVGVLERPMAVLQSIYLGSCQVGFG